MVESAREMAAWNTDHMGLLTPLAIKVGSIPWMPKYLPQIVKCDKAIAALTRQRYGLLDIAGLPHITVIVRGRRSGVERATALLAAPTDAGWLIAGSYFGGPDMPQWVFNLRATDTVKVRHAGLTSEATVRELDGDERAQAWRVLRATWPNFDLYEKRTDRKIPVFSLVTDEREDRTTSQ